MRASKAGWVLVVAILGGCGGATITIPDPDGGPGGGGDSGGSDGGLSDSGIVGCPSTPPAPGSACPVSCPPQGAPCLALECEYGPSPVFQCNALYTCNGTWSSNAGGGDPQFCTPSTSGCPATRAAVSVGMSCAPSGLECDYPDGRCACTAPSSGPVRVDGGTEWLCDSPQASCPVPRPRVGSACTTAGQTCDYGACTLPGGVSLTCDGGLWQNRPVPCPV